MPSIDQRLRIAADQAGMQGAYKYGIGGVVPADARAVTYSVHGSGVPYVSDAPYVPTEVPYNDRPTCVGSTVKGTPCKGKARSGGRCCEAHVDQE